MKRVLTKADEELILEEAQGKILKILLMLENLEYDDSEKELCLKGIRINAKAIHESILELRK